VDSLIQYEDFSFVSNGINGFLQAALVMPKRYRMALNQETVRRFEQTETRTGMAVQWMWNKPKSSGRETERMNRYWVDLALLYSPRLKGNDTKILPQWSPAFGFGFLPFQKMVLHTQYQFSDYDTANSHTFSVDSEWYILPRFYTIMRVNEVGTDFPSVSNTIWNASFLLQPVIEIVPERLRFLFLYAHSNEPFESGAPDETRSFSADIFHVGLIAEIKHFKVRIGWEYEKRSTPLFVRRYNISLVQKW